MTLIRDFIYLDIQRLRSFASQLFEGVPESRQKSGGKQTEFGGAVKGRIPLIIEGAASTKAVLSATSTVTSEIHHQLIADVVDGLTNARLLWAEQELAEAPDGAFVQLRGQLQIIDPDSLRELVVKLPGVSRAAIQATTKDQVAVVRSKADRRAGRKTPSQPDEGVSKAQADAIATLLSVLTPGTVRVRVIRNEEAIAIAVVERDKFVEDLDRLVRRHGYLTGGEWEVLAQINEPPSPDFFTPTGTTVMDLLESEMLVHMKTLGDATGTTSGAEPSITPLAIYRIIERAHD